MQGTAVSEKHGGGCMLPMEGGPHLDLLLMKVDSSPGPAEVPEWMRAQLRILERVNVSVQPHGASWGE